MARSFIFILTFSLGLSMLKYAMGMACVSGATELCILESQSTCSASDDLSASCSFPCTPDGGDTENSSGCCDLCCAPGCCVFVVPNFEFQLWSFPDQRHEKSEFGAPQFTPQQFHLSIWRPPAGRMNAATV